MNAAPLDDTTPSPWHDGERTLQERLGVAERMERAGRRVIRDYMPDQHRTFFRQLPFVVLGAVDAKGAVWATLLDGLPGFAHSPDPRTLRLDTHPILADPATYGLGVGSAVGLLGIEQHTRRRNRMNGKIARVDEKGFDITVDQSFGNCPQYIHSRQCSFHHELGPRNDTISRRDTSLNEFERDLIRTADTFFVASYVDIDGDPNRRGIDVSHRGGKPGFVRVQENALTIPDFAGNLHFNTLGNFLVNPRAGLVFVDFERGHLVHLSGRVEIIFDSPEIAAFQGAERLWQFTVEQVIVRQSTLALRFLPGQTSPNSLLTGSWEQTEAKIKAEALRNSFRPFRVANIVDESSTIRSFYLEPVDNAGISVFRAGQHLPIRLNIESGAPPVLRTYTLSTAPSDGRYRISVKRQGKASQYLHDRVHLGDIVEARAPAGNFTIDAAQLRPVVLISGGVGITPMLSMLRHIVYEGLRTRRMRPTWFLHASSTRAERPFDAELLELANTAGDSLRIVQVLSSVEGHALAGHEYQGRIDSHLLRQVLPFDDYDFYLCGPPGMTQNLYDELRNLRIPDDRIHAEAFGPAALKRRFDKGAEKSFLPVVSTNPVPVTFSRAAKEATWIPLQGSLLDLAEAQALTPEFSCRGGSCGTCKTRVLQGQVTYPTQPSAEHAPDQALICCAVPAENSERLILDL